MFKKGRDKVASLTARRVEVAHTPDKSNTADQVALILQSKGRELAARFASLLMICYQRRDISGMHITLTALTHTLHTLDLWSEKQSIREQMKGFVLHEGFPIQQSSALDWLLNHYFELPNDGDESVLLNWYQSLDDEWVLRKNLREMFPDKNSSELTPLIAIEKAAQQASEQER